MVSIDPVSITSAKDLRQQFRRERRLKFCQSTWRLLFLCGLGAGLFWSMRLPYWFIHGNSQIEVKGNSLMIQDDVLSLLSLNYPQYLWQINTETIIKQLESSKPIVDAQVTRQLLPPRLTVYIQERQPIALVVSNQLNENITSPSSVLIGFLDREGVFIPEHFYHQANLDLPTPTLKVMGFEAQYQPYWLEIVQFIENSQVKIFEIDWRQPTALVLKTELGTFYLGNYTQQLSQQLSVLEQMGELPQKIDLSQIDYIDLSNPSQPSIKLKR